MLSIEDISVFAKKKGFVYPTAEIYGGLAGFYDFGNLGVELKNNLKNELWKEFTRREDVIGLDGSIITHDNVWKASGHVESFEDFILECRKCHNKFRADLLIEDKLKINVEEIKKEDIDTLIKKNNLKCKCGGDFSEAKHFNLMFSTEVGPMSSYLSYLRPETAQLIFTDFKLLMENNRMKLPFGVAQIGKAFRNEISPRDFLFRIREFEMFEIEYFVDPNKLKECPYIKDVLRLKLNVLTGEMQKDKKQHKEMTIEDMLKKKIGNPWQLYWLAMFYKFYLNFGIKKENLRLREHLKEELAHYASACFDIEYNFPFGWKEIHGNADRGKFDLTQHMKYSKTDLSVYNEETKERVIPYVASEPSQGIERAFLVFLYDAYNDDKKRGNIVLKLDPRLAPIKLAVFPLVNKLEKQSKRIYDELKTCFNCFYDKSGSIGRRYARQDEIGTPLCCTIDFQTLKDNTVTLRERDTTNQVRVKIKELKDKIWQYIYEEANFKDLGKAVKQ